MPITEQIKKLLKTGLDSKVFYLVKRIGAFADKEGIKAYIVGGMVRDMFLKRKTLDIDIVVEGNGTEFARRLAYSFHGSYKKFDRFKTAKIFLKNRRIDVASARTEIYAKPAALPKVDFTNLKKDLFRRDFTINAMAVCINREKFGEFIDYFEGYKDLQLRVLRPLHNKSFIDDPTRILRLVRFETRFNFKIEHNTLLLLKKILKNDIFDIVPGERLRNEILILLNEEEPLKAMLRLQQLNILKKLNKNFWIDSSVIKLYKKLKIVKFVKDENSGIIMRFMVFTSNLGIKAIAQLLNRLKFSNDWKKIVLDAKQNSARILKGLNARKVKDSKIYDLLKRYMTETLLYFALIADSKKAHDRIEHYIHVLKNAKIAISGKDLKDLGIKEGPEYRRILDKIMSAKIDGTAKNKAEQILLIKNTKK